jgi:alpha-L-arabinofuranosidase
VLGLAGPYIDGVSMHNAYVPLWSFTKEGTVPPDDYLFTVMFGATEAVTRVLDVMEAQLNRLGRPIPIFVTEYDGIFYPDETKENPDRTVIRNPTLGSAVFNASVMNIFARHPRVYGAYHMALADPLFGSLIGQDRGGRFKNPQFYVFQEYGREAGNVVVGLELVKNNATFNSGPINGLGGQTNVPMLDALATKSPDEKTFALFVANRSLTETVRASHDLRLPAGVTGTVSTLNGPSYLSRNSSQAPNTVTLTTQPFATAGPFTYDFPPHSVTIFRWKK